MRIAICGAGSTGKTTLSKKLLDEPLIKQLNLKSIDVDARRIIDAMHHMNIDNMTCEERIAFQREYAATKIALEENETDYITQRSFVDIAAYWVVRDAVNETIQFKQEMIDLCRKWAMRYDKHIFIPFGQIPIEFDGYRSLDTAQYYAVSEKIEWYLNEWKIGYHRISSANLCQRIESAKAYILK